MIEIDDIAAVRAAIANRDAVGMVFERLDQSAVRALADRCEGTGGTAPPPLRRVAPFVDELLCGLVGWAVRERGPVEALAIPFTLGLTLGVRIRIVGEHRAEGAAEAATLDPMGFLAEHGALHGDEGADGIIGAGLLDLWNDLRSLDGRCRALLRVLARYDCEGWFSDGGSPEDRVPRSCGRSRGRELVGDPPRFSFLAGLVAAGVPPVPFPGESVEEHPVGRARVSE